MCEMNQLVNIEDLVWLIIQNWLKDVINYIEFLSVNKDLVEIVFYQLQVIIKSSMGVFVYGFGGLLIDNGWLCIVGFGYFRLL